MIEVKRQYWSCMGETVLKKTQFDQDTANARAANRVEMDELGKMVAAQQRAQTPIQPAALPQFLSFLPPALQRGLQAILRPMQQVMTFVLATPQQLAQMTGQVVRQTVGQLEKAMSQMLSFFFGHKKDKTEEKEQRDRNDESLPDIFGDNPTGPNKIQQKENTHMGANR